MIWASLQYWTEWILKTQCMLAISAEQLQNTGFYWWSGMESRCFCNWVSIANFDAGPRTLLTAFVLKPISTTKIHCNYGRKHLYSILLLNQDFLQIKSVKCHYILGTNGAFLIHFNEVETHFTLLWREAIFYSNLDKSLQVSLGHDSIMWEPIAYDFRSWHTSDCWFTDATFLDLRSWHRKMKIFDIQWSTAFRSGLQKWSEVRYSALLTPSKLVWHWFYEK